MEEIRKVSHVTNQDTRKKENNIREAIFKQKMAENFSQNDFIEFSSDLSIHKFKIPSESQQDK